MAYLAVENLFRREGALCFLHDADSLVLCSQLEVTGQALASIHLMAALFVAEILAFKCLRRVCHGVAFGVADVV